MITLLKNYKPRNLLSHEHTSTEQSHTQVLYNLT